MFGLDLLLASIGGVGPILPALKNHLWDPEWMPEPGEVDTLRAGLIRSRGRDIVPTAMGKDGEYTSLIVLISGWNNTGQVILRFRGVFATAQDAIDNAQALIDLVREGVEGRPSTW